MSEGNCGDGSATVPLAHFVELVVVKVRVLVAVLSRPGSALKVVELVYLQALVAVLLRVGLGAARRLEAGRAAITSVSSV